MLQFFQQLTVSYSSLAITRWPNEQSGIGKEVSGIFNNSPNKSTAKTLIIQFSTPRRRFCLENSLLWWNIQHNISCCTVRRYNSRDIVSSAPMRTQTHTTCFSAAWWQLMNSTLSVVRYKASLRLNGAPAAAATAGVCAQNPMN